MDLERLKKARRDGFECGMSLAKAGDEVKNQTVLSESRRFRNSVPNPFSQPPLLGVHRIGTIGVVPITKIVKSVIKSMDVG